MFSKDYVCVDSHITEYVDNQYFRKNFKAFIQNAGELIDEDDDRKNWNSYPVKI